MTRKVGILDWSGTVSNDFPPVYGANMKLHDHFGLPRFTEDEFRANLQPTMVDYIRALGVDEATASDAEIKALFKQEFDAQPPPEPFDFSRDTLKRLDKLGLVMAVLSTHPQENVVGEAERYGFSQHFQIIRAGVDDKAKSLPGLLRDLGVTPDEAFICGDGVQDINIPGVIRRVGVLSGYHSKDELSALNPDYLMTNISSLPNLLALNLL